MSLLMPLNPNTRSAISTVIAWTLLVGIVGWFLLRTVAPAAHTLTNGFMGYYVGGRTVLHDELPHLYDHEWFDAQVKQQSDGKVRDIFFANPPILAAVWAPLASMNVSDARSIWIWFNVLMIGSAFYLIATGLTSQVTIWNAVLLAGLLTLPTPARQQIYLGQMYGLLLLLHTIAWRAYIDDRDALAGIAVGLAIALKLSGWPIALLLLAQRRSRALLYTTLTVAAAVVLTLPFVGLGAWVDLFTIELPYALSRPEASLSAFQTTAGFWQHLFRYDASFNPAPIANLPLLATLLTIATTVAACGALVLRSRPVYRSFAAAIALIELLSPAAEQYHYIVLLLPLAIVWRDAWVAKSRSFLFVAAAATLLVGFPLEFGYYHGGWLAIADYPRLFGGWMIFIALLSAPPSLPPLRFPTEPRVTRAPPAQVLS